jgi:hypothetical protein
MSETHHQPGDTESRGETHPVQNPTDSPAGIQVEKEVKAQSHDYLSGIRLLSLVVSTTIVGFLMLMDSSIISTVRMTTTYSCYLTRKS